MMNYEIENKYTVGDLDAIRSKLAQLGAAAEPPIDQADHYFAHPQRNFAETDEAFRMRSVGDATYLTYKGPKFDAATKSRPEEEVRLLDGPQNAARCQAMLSGLGFQPVAVVRKRRTPFRLDRNGQQFEVALDAVENVGTFVEIELTVEAERVDDPSIVAAQSAVVRLAEQLGLGQPQRTSYLELLLARDR